MTKEAQEAEKEYEQAPSKQSRYYTRIKRKKETVVFIVLFKLCDCAVLAPLGHKEKGRELREVHVYSR